MVHTKNMERKYQAGLPVARFPVSATGRAERGRHYLAKQQLPPQNEELDWTNLSPSLSRTESPKLERAVDQINEEFANPPSRNMEEVFELVQDLRAHPPASPVTETVTSEDPNLPTPHSKAGTEAAVPTPLPPTITSETVAEAVRPPLLLAKRAMATLAPRKGRPNPPLTAATKRPHREFQQPNGEVARRKPKKPKALSALREIKKLQTEVKPIIPWRPFVRVIHELLFDKGPYKIRRDAIKALRIVGKEYLIEVLGGGNLACMHRNCCTLTPKDIRLFRRLRGDIDSTGETTESEEARKADWEPFNRGRLTMGKAMVLDTNWRRKLRALLQRRRGGFLQGRC